jgi:O-antigen ligase
MKRGALLVLPAMLMSGMFVEAIITKRVFRTTARAMLSLILLSVGIHVADLASGGYLLARFSIEEISSGSGRVAMYSTVIESLSLSSPWSLFFGHGSGAVEQLLDMAAHNEWLEFIYNFGIFGIFLYALLFLALGFRLANLVRKSSRFAQGYAMAVAYLCVVGLLSQTYFAHSTFYIMAFLGAVEGLMINEARNARVLSVSCDQCRQQGAVQ